MEFLAWLDQFIMLHTLKNGPSNEKNEALQHLRTALKIIPTKFYLDQNNWSVDELESQILTFIEDKPQIRGDKEIQFFKEKVLPAYREYLQTESSRMHVEREA